MLTSKEQILSRSLLHVRDLEVWLDSYLSLDTQILKICKSCYFQVEQYAVLLELLSLLLVLIIAKVSYTVRLRRIYSAYNKYKNALARVFCKMPYSAHVMPTLQCLHWLLIKYRIDYKVALLTWESLNISQPTYLSYFLRSKS